MEFSESDLKSVCCFLILKKKRQNVFNQLLELKKLSFLNKPKTL